MSHSQIDAGQLQEEYEHEPLVDRLFDGEGEMRALCRALDWSATPLGASAQWPLSLRTTVANMLASRHPMFLWWGPELIQIYNDAYRPSFAEGGRHPHALGARGAEFWTDIWEIIGPQIAQVMGGGPATWHEDHLVPIIRNGRLEDVWWTYGYSPAFDDAGNVAGVLVVCQETTTYVLANREREQLLADTARAERRVARVLEQVSDEHLTMDAQFRILSVNRAARRALGRTEGELIGRTHWEAFPASVGSELERHYRAVMATRAEAHFTYHYVGEAYDRILEIDAYPTDDGGIALFWREISERVRAEAALRDSVARYRALFDSLDEGFTVLEMVFEDGKAVDYVYLETNPAFVKQTGLADAVGRRTRELIPDQESYWFEAYGRVALTGEPVRFEAPVEGLHRWFNVYAFRVGSAEQRRVAVLFSDVTAAREATVERDRLLRALELERSRLAEVFRQAPAFLAVLRGANHVIELANDAYYQLIGHRAIIGKPLSDALPEVAEQGFIHILDGVLNTGAPFVGREARILLARTPNAEPEERFVDFVYLPLTEADGSRVGVIAHGTDVTEQVLARLQVERVLAESERARADAEAARERTTRLQELTAALSVSSTVGQIADAIVAHTARLFGAVDTIVAKLSDDGEHLEIVQASRMPEEVRGAWHRFPLSAPVPIADVVRSGEPLFLESREEWHVRYPGTEALLEATGHHANIIIPLFVEGHRFGALGAAFDAPRHFSADDRATALTIGRQCAQALDRARLFEAAQVAREAAEAANRTKGEFLAVMSHELRTPLNAIGGYAELMEMGIRGPVSNEQREDLRRIQNSQRHLLGLINEVLNYAKLETGTVQYDFADVPVREALSAAESLVAPQARTKGLALVVAEHPLSLQMRADPEKLRQILVNLLSNAVKFTDTGGRIEMSASAEDGLVTVVVRDTGMGIPAEKLDAIFDPFVQVRSDLSRPHEGTGLGLAISRDLARGMGGDLTVTSELGVGSAFSLTLPTP